MTSPRMPRPAPPPPAPTIVMPAAQQSEADLRTRERRSRGTTMAGLVQPVPLGAGGSYYRTILGSGFGVNSAGRNPVNPGLYA